MIYLNSDIYSSEFEDKHIARFSSSAKKLKKGLIKFYRNDIDQLGEDKFIRALLINPFSQESRQFKLLHDYFEITQFLQNNADYFNEGKKNRKLLNVSQGSISKLSDTLHYQYFKFILNKKDLDRLEDYFKKIKGLNYSNMPRDHKVNIVDASGINVCPYCNRQFVDVFDTVSQGPYTHGQLDHFYNQNIFPLYAISLYNLVPSCAKCNLLKSDKLGGYIYPFVDTKQEAEEKNHRKYFEVQCNDIFAMNPISRKSPDVSIRVIPTKVEEKLNAKNSHHEEIYQGHKDFVRRLLRNKALDNDFYKKEISKLFQTSSNKKVSEKFLEQAFKEVLFGFSGDLEELKQKPLSKLAHDILDLNKK